MNARTGKIARLPEPTRDELNTRIRDGQTAEEILAWLNARPDVNAVTAHDFDNKSVNEVNLTHWRNGGYRDWLESQETAELIEKLALQTSPASLAEPRQLINHMRLAFTVKLAKLLNALTTEAANTETGAARLIAIGAQLSALERIEAERQRLQNEDAWLKLAGARLEDKKQERQDRIELGTLRDRSLNRVKAKLAEISDDAYDILVGTTAATLGKSGKAKPKGNASKTTPPAQHEPPPEKAG